MSCYPNYTESYFINRHDADFMGYLKPGAFLRFAQQIATNQCTALGFTPEFFESHRCAYLLAKQTLVFHRVPHIDETLTLTTMPEKTKHASSRRITIAKDANGETVAEVHSWWVLVDLDSHHIMRRGMQELDACWNDTVEASMEFVLPKTDNLHPLTPCAADYRSCDMNQHMNNCVYADLVCASVPLEQVRKTPIRMISVSYHREVVMGDTLLLQAGQTENGFYTCGTRQSDGQPAFEAYCTL